MSNDQWTLLHTAQSYDEAKDFAKSRFNVCQYRRSNLNNHTKYSFKCSEYRKYPSCSFEIKIIVSDNNIHSVTVMSRNLHQHEENERNPTTRLPSPIRKTVSNYVKGGLSQSQIKTSLIIDHPQSSISEVKLNNLIHYERRKDRSEIFSVYDLRKWCDEHKEGTQLYSTFVPFYDIDNEKNLFVFFTTKQLLQQIRFITYLQIDATCKIRWNNLPLLIFGSTDFSRHFKPFGIALVSHDENAECYTKIFSSINTLAVQEFDEPCLINQVMAENAQAVTSAQELIFPKSRRLICWNYMFRKCRTHRHLVTDNDWQIINKDIHTLQLAFSDDIFDHGVKLLLQKWSLIPTMKKFVDYFNEQWVAKLRYWYEGAAFGKPSTNNGLESLTRVIKQKYTLRNNLPLSTFLLKLEMILFDWSKASVSSPFSTVTDISPDIESNAYKWSLNVNRSEILNWCNNYYIVPSSTAIMKTSVWLDIYKTSQWASFDDYAAWKSSCWLVSPLAFCTCPIGLKEYRCKHSVGLAMLFNMYRITDKLVIHH